MSGKTSVQKSAAKSTRICVKTLPSNQIRELPLARCAPQPGRDVTWPNAPCYYSQQLKLWDA
eukprot:2421662-Pleurochrysis_carterae.AAC.3